MSMDEAPFEAHASEALDRLLEVYRIESADLFARLAGANPTRTKPRQFELFRANYFCRTASTLPCLTQVLTATVRQIPLDKEVVELVLRTIQEEAGLGSASPPHPELLCDALNTHAERIFGLPHLSLGDACSHPLVLKEALSYRDTQQKLYQSDAFGTVLGAFAAQECAAQEMLHEFYQSLVAPYRHHYSDVAEWGRVERYFSSHLNGVEEEHGRRARLCALRALKNVDDTRAFSFGASTFLNAQASLWSAMSRAWEGAE